MDILSIVLVLLVILWAIGAVVYLVRHRGTGCCGTGSSCQGCCEKCGGCHQCTDKGLRNTDLTEQQTDKKP
jgi:hypothetical protein